MTSLLEDYKEKPYETTMIKAVMFSIDQTIKPDDSEINQLTDYLFKVEHWGNYEIVLLGNCTRFINYNTLFLLTKEMLTSFAYSEQNKSNKILVTQLAINCLIISIDHHYFENSHYLISKIQDLLTDEIQFYEKTIFLYVYGYYKLKQGDLEGKKEMEDALRIFQLLKEKALYDVYLEHYHKQVSPNAFQKD